MILKLKKVALIVIGYLVVSCGSGNDRGELVGVKGGQWKQPKPYFNNRLFPCPVIFLNRPSIIYTKRRF